MKDLAIRHIVAWRDREAGNDMTKWRFFVEGGSYFLDEETAKRAYLSLWKEGKDPLLLVDKYVEVKQTIEIK